jgi:hypothetical protein
MAARPYSEAGSRMVADAVRIEVLCATRPSSSASAVAAGMRGDDGGGFKAGGVGTGLGGDGLQFAIDPGGADEHARLTFESIGEVDDAGSGAGGALPVPEGELLVAGKEGEVHAIEGVGIDALDEADLIADGFEAAQLGFVIHELEIGVGKGENRQARR